MDSDIGVPDRKKSGSDFFLCLCIAVQKCTCISRNTVKPLPFVSRWAQACIDTKSHCHDCLVYIGLLLSFVCITLASKSINYLCRVEIHFPRKSAPHYCTNKTDDFGVENTPTDLLFTSNQSLWSTLNVPNAETGEMNLIHVNFCVQSKEISTYNYVRLCMNGLIQELSLTSLVGPCFAGPTSGLSCG